jgi:hypothetical protein
MYFKDPSFHFAISLAEGHVVTTPDGTAELHSTKRLYLLAIAILILHFVIG